MRRHMTACTHQILSNCRLPIYFQKKITYIFSKHYKVKNIQIYHVRSKFQFCKNKISSTLKHANFTTKKKLCQEFFFSTIVVYTVYPISSAFLSDRIVSDIATICPISLQIAGILLYYISIKARENYLSQHIFIYTIRDWLEMRPGTNSRTCAREDTYRISHNAIWVIVLY